MNLSYLLVVGAAVMSMASHANAWMDKESAEYEFGTVSDVKNSEEDQFVGTSGAFSGINREKGVNQIKNNDDDWTIMKIFERAQKEHPRNNDKHNHGNHRNLNGVGHPKHTLEQFVGTSGAFAGFDSHARRRNDESELETHRNDNRVTHRNHNHSLEETFANNEDFSGFELKTNQQSQIGNSANHKHFNRNDGHLNRIHPDGGRILHPYHNHVFGQAIGTSGAFAESQVNQMKNNDIDWTTLESLDI